MSPARELILLALGSPREPDAKAALEIALEAIQSETQVLADKATSDAHLLAIACRLEALKEFVTEFVTVQWAESEGAS